MKRLFKKPSPLVILIVICICIVGISIGIGAYGNKSQSLSNVDQTATTTFGLGTPLFSQTNQQITNNSNNYTAPTPYAPTEEQTISNIPSSQPKSDISILYPTSNQTLTNDPKFHTPIASLLWKTKSTNIKNVTVDLRDQNGVIIKNIASNVVNTGTFVWFSDATIPNGVYQIYVYNDAAEAQGISDTFILTSPNSTQHPTSAWQTYTNPQYGFSFTYPDDFKFTTFNQSYPGNIIAKIAPMLNVYIRVNDYRTVDASEITVTAKPGTATSCPSTAETTSTLGYSYENKTIAQGIYQQFTKIIRKAFFDTNNQHSEYADYYTLYRGTCYAFHYSVHIVRVPFSPDSLYLNPDKLENDLARLFGIVEQMALSLKFL